MSNVFEGKRADVTHRYEVLPEGVGYIAGSRTQLTVPWKNVARLQAARGGAVALIGYNRRKLVLWLPPETMKRFFDAFFTEWKKHDRGAALKAAFDYGSDERSIGWIWLGLTFGFPGLLAAMLLTDGYNTRRCTGLLEQGKITNAEVVKIKKNRRGNYVWDLSFKTEAGETVTGKREAPIHDEKGNPNGAATVVYSPEDPKCWDVSLKSGEKAINHSQRHFQLLLSLCFGWLFAVVAAIATFFGIRRLRHENPYRAEVQAHAKL